MNKLLSSNRYIHIACYSVVCLSLCFAGYLRAAAVQPLPNGQPVSDSAVHWYLTQGLQKSVTSIELMRQQLITADQHYKTVKAAADKWKRTYYNIKGSIRWVDKWRKKLKDPHALGDEWFGAWGRIMGKDMEAFLTDTYSDDAYQNAENIRKWLKKMAEADAQERKKKPKPPQLPDEEQRKFRVQKERQRARVNELKQKRAIAAAFDTVADMPARVDELKRSAVAATVATDEKAMTQTTNALLCQLIDTQNRMLYIQALYFDAALSTITAGNSNEVIRSEIEKALTRQDEIRKEANFKRMTGQE